jgi:two-component system cell cycle sensor histidine kinase/response regulator CckA
MSTLLLLEGPSRDETPEPWRGAPDPEPAQTSLPARRRVLVAEDDWLLCRMIARLLEEEGYEVVLARNGADALRQALAGPTVDLVVTDIRMPVMDGWELSRQLRQRWPALPVLYMSGFDVELTRDAADGRTSAIFLRKPFELDELSRRVARLLGEG